MMPRLDIFLDLGFFFRIPVGPFGKKGEKRNFKYFEYFFSNMHLFFFPIIYLIVNLLTHCILRCILMTLSIKIRENTK